MMFQIASPKGPVLLAKKPSNTQVNDVSENHLSCVRQKLSII
jgi:hypothetical protein